MYLDDHILSSLCPCAEQVRSFYATQHQSGFVHACVAACQYHLNQMLRPFCFNMSASDITKMQNMRLNAHVLIAGIAAGHESL
jgi:hypothetical protein